MEPIKKYEVLASVEVEGTLHDVGAVVELAESVAKPFVEGGQLKEVEAPQGGDNGSAPVEPPVAPQNEPGGAATVPEAPAPQGGSEAPQNSVPATPEVPKAPEPAAKQEGGWVGGHVPAGNERNPHKGGAVTDRHPDLVPKA